MDMENYIPLFQTCILFELEGDRSTQFPGRCSVEHKYNHYKQ